MKRIFLAACAMGLLAFGAARTALAATDVELVSGSDVILWDSTTLSCFNGAVVACTTFGATATIGSIGGETQETVAATNFNGWHFTTDTGNSFSPSCSGTAICIEQNHIDTNASGAAALNSFFGATGFTPIGNLLLTEAGTNFAGIVSATGFAYTGGLGFSSTAAPTLAGLWGPLSLVGSGNVALSAGPVSTPAPAAPYNLADEISLATGTGNYNVTSTISTVPEPTSAISFGGVLLLSATALRKKLRKA